MSTIDTSTWSPDSDLNVDIGGIPLNADASIQQTWQAIQMLMAALKGDTAAIKLTINQPDGTTIVATNQTLTVVDNGHAHTIANVTGLQTALDGKAANAGMQGATASADGASGLVPQPLAGDQDKVLKGDGTWGTLSASDIPNIDASKITSGTIDLARLPAGALERLVTVANQTARYALTTADVQLGDTVKEEDTGLLYFIVDTDELDNAAGYEIYTAGAAASVPWSGVTSKPSSFTPSAHASSATTYGVSDASNYGHAKASSTTPSANGTASAGSETGSFARGDHVHPLQTSVSGNAGSASEFTSAQSVTLTGAVTGTASSKAGWAVPTKWRSCLLGRNDGNTTNPWYKVASYHMGGGSLDLTTVFLIEDTYRTKRHGILKVHVRTGYDGSIDTSMCKMEWLIHTGFTLASFVLVCPTGTDAAVEIWTSIDETYMLRRFTVLSEGLRTTTDTRWTFFNTVSAGQAASITTAGTQIVSTEAGRTAYANVAGDLQAGSDERLKTPLSAVPDAVLDAWESVGWGQFKFLSAINCKGDFARLHLGLIAQRVQDIFESKGLDACNYGILCHDAENDQWTVRYMEALAMEAICQRRRADRLEERIKALEAAND